MKGFEFIDDHKGQFDIAVMCRALGVSKSGYYEWIKRPPSVRKINDEILTARIAQIHADSRETYGYRRVTNELNDTGGKVDEKHVHRLMADAGIQGLTRRKFHRTTKRDKRQRPAPDLLNRNFTAEAPDQVYVADVTYVTTWAGILFLATVLDVHTRKIVGWHTSSIQDAKLVTTALMMALSRQCPESGVIHHSDQGSTYTSGNFKKACEKSGVRISMGSVADCYDNAMAESFFATIECELLDRSVFENRHQARTAIFDYIERFYNLTRRHSGIGGVSPANFEKAWRNENRDQSAAA